MEEVVPPMTRLRRRLSVEQNEDFGSPSTPTKQRARKLLKPALEDISENAIAGNQKRTTRLSLAPEAASNTESVTPSKITRARANSSLSESLQNVESPRVLRATKRNSIAGSDAETSVILTPVRRSRRISKDFQKSPETIVDIKVQGKRAIRGSTAARDTILEENKSETDLSVTNKSFPGCKTPTEHKKSPHVSNENSPGNARKSPRLSSKKNNASVSEELSENIAISSSDKSADQLERGVNYKNNPNLDTCSITYELDSMNQDTSIRKLVTNADQKNRSLDSILKSPCTQKNGSLNNPQLFSLQTSHEDEIIASESKNNSVTTDHIKYSELDADKPAVVSSTIYFEDLDGMDEKELSKKENHSSITIGKDDSVVSMEVDITMSDTLLQSIKQSSASKNVSVEISIQDDNFKTTTRNRSRASDMFENSTQETKTNSNNLSAQNNIQSNGTLNGEIKEKYLHEDEQDAPAVQKNFKTEQVPTKKTPNRQDKLKSGVFTSTPVQKGVKQILDKNNSIEQKKLVESESEDRSPDANRRNELLKSEAIDAGEDYQSGDSQNESERENAEENEIPVNGETLDSDEEGSDDTNYEKDSFVVSSDNEDDELLTGSGDDLSISENELKMTKKSKDKYDKKKAKEQKRASKEMFEARHGKAKGNSQAEESDDPEITFAGKNKKRNRMRFDSSKEISDDKIDEREISVMGEMTQSEKDPLTADLTIKKEILDASSNNNTLIEEIENVSVAENLTIITNNDEKNPLESIVGENEMTNSESSDDGGITNNYSALLSDLNKSSNKNKSMDCSAADKKWSFSETMEQKEHKFNVTLSDKIKVVKSPNQENSEEPTKQKSFDDTCLRLASIEYKSKEKTNINLQKSLEKQLETSSKEIEAESIRKEKAELKPKQHKKRNLSLNEGCKEKIKDDSIMDKFNLTKSGKEKKPKPPKSVGDKMSEESSDAFDFQLLFNQEDDSDKAMEVYEEIPLKRCEAKTNLLSDERVSEKDLSTSKQGGNKISTMAKQPVALEEPNNVNIENKRRVRRKKSKIRQQATEVNKEQRDQENSRKRKVEDCVLANNNKVYLTSSQNKIKVTKLPQSIIQKLEDKPQITPLEKYHKAASVIATSSFEVKSITLRQNKPSHYLEESIHIDKSPVIRSNKVQHLKNPKVLPSVPKAKTSADGFTSNFKVNILKQDKRHDAVAAQVENEIVNFKTQRLYGPSIARITTEKLCRKQKKIKLTRY